MLHDENHPSASLWLGKEGAFLYSDHHRNGTQRTYTLTQVYAFRAAGCEWKMEPSEHARQKLRMLIDLGLVEPPEIELPPLPTDADPALMWGYGRLRLLLQARALGEDVSEPFPLTQRFFARWCVSGEAVARRVIRDLRRSGVIIKVGEFPSAFGTPDGAVPSRPSGPWRVAVMLSSPPAISEISCVSAREERHSPNPRCSSESSVAHCCTTLLPAGGALLVPGGS